MSKRQFEQHAYVSASSKPTRCLPVRTPTVPFDAWFEQRTSNDVLTTAEGSLTEVRRRIEAHAAEVVSTVTNKINWNKCSENDRTPWLEKNVARVKQNINDDKSLQTNRPPWLEENVAIAAAWLHKLPSGSFTAREVELKDAIFEFFAKSYGEKHVSLLELVMDQRIANICRSLLPEAVSLRDWLGQRMGNDVRFTPTADDCYLELSVEAHAEVQYHYKWWNKLPSDSYTYLETKLRTAIFAFFVKQDLEHQPSLHELEKDAHIKSCITWIPKAISFRRWIEQRMGDMVIAADGFHLELSLEARAEVRRRKENSSLVKALIANKPTSRPEVAKVETQALGLDTSAVAQVPTNKVAGGGTRALGLKTGGVVAQIPKNKVAKVETRALEAAAQVPTNEVVKSKTRAVGLATSVVAQVPTSEVAKVETRALGLKTRGVFAQIPQNKVAKVETRALEAAAQVPKNEVTKVETRADGLDASAAARVPKSEVAKFETRALGFDASAVAQGTKNKMLKGALWLDKLPLNSYKTEERHLRDAIFDFFAKREGEDGASLHELENDSNIKHKRSLFMPKIIPLGTWIEQRMGNDVSMAADGLHLDLSPEARAEARRREKIKEEKVAKDAEWLDKLPPDSYKTEERHLRDAIFDFFAKREGEDGASLHELENDSNIKHKRAFMPKIISFSTWIEQRMGNDVLMAADGLHLDLSPEARAEANRREQIKEEKAAKDAGWLDKLPSDSYTISEKTLRNAIFDFFAKREGEDRASLHALEKHSYIECKRDFIPKTISFATWMAQRMGNDVEMRIEGDDCYLELLPEAHAEVARRITWLEDLPFDSYTPEEKYLRSMIFNFFAKREKEERAAFRDLENNSRVIQARNRCLPSFVSLREWIEQRMGNDVLIEEDGYLDLSLEARAEVRSKTISHELQKSCIYTLNWRDLKAIFSNLLGRPLKADVSYEFIVRDAYVSGEEGWSAVMLLSDELRAIVRLWGLEEEMIGPCCATRERAQQACTEQYVEKALAANPDFGQYLPREQPEGENKRKRDGRGQTRRERRVKARLDQVRESGETADPCSDVCD